MYHFCNEHVKTFSTACFTLLGCYWLRQKFFSLPSDVDSKLYLSNACNSMLTGDWTIFMRCLLILVTVAGMSTTSSWAACSRTVSMAISVPVLPTPALQGDSHCLDEPFMAWICTHTHHSQRLGTPHFYFYLTCSAPVWILWRVSPGPSSDGGS